MTETLKLPDHVVIKNLLVEMGQDKAYIEELESNVRKFKQDLNLTKEERKEMKKGVVYIELKNKIEELEKTISRLRKENYELIGKLTKT